MLLDWMIAGGNRITCTKRDASYSRQFNYELNYELRSGLFEMGFFRNVIHFFQSTKAQSRKAFSTCH